MKMRSRLQQQLIRLVVAMLLLAQLASGLQPAQLAQAANEDSAVGSQPTKVTRTVTIVQLIEEASAWLVNQGPVTDDWYAYTLGQAGKTIESGYLDAAKERVQSFTGATLPTEYAKLTLGVKAAGGDPQSFAGRNLLEPIYNRTDLAAQGANGVIYGLLALDSGSYTIPTDAVWTKDKLVGWLVQRHIKDQGWALNESDTTAQIDITAAALWALAPYKDRADVAVVVQEAVSWLATRQLDNGDLTVNRTNSNSLAMAVLGLSKQQKDGRQGSFAKPEGSLISALMHYSTGDGGFSYQAGGASDKFSTYQSLLALVAYDTLTGGLSGTYTVPVYTGSTNGKASVFIHVETSEGTMAEGFESARTPLEALQQLAARHSLPVVTMDSPFFDVYAIGGKAKNTSHGNYHYWGFNIKRNGTWTGDWDWKSTQLQPGDELAVMFGPYLGSALLDKIELEPKVPRNKEPFQVKVTQLDGMQSVPAAVYVKVGGQTVWTDAAGIAYFPGGYEATDERIEVTGALVNGFPSVVRGVQELPSLVQVRVEGPAGSLVAKQERASSVYEALQHTVTEHVYTDGMYFGISSVNGIEASGFHWWGFAVKRAGVWASTGGWKDTALQRGDEVLIYYSGMDTQIVHQYALTPSVPKAGQGFTIQVEQASWQGTSKAAGIQVRIGQTTVTTDTYGIAAFSGLPAGMHELVISGYREHDAPLIARWSAQLNVAPNVVTGSGSGEQAPSVSVSVDGGAARGSILSASSTPWQSGDTAYSVLVRALGADRVVSIGSGSSLYVSGIDGLNEFAHGPKSGWLYAVNCSYPSNSASSYALSQGDRVYWKYTVNGGDDVKATELPGCSSGGGSSGPVVGVNIADTAAKLDEELKKLTIRYDHQTPVSAKVATVVVKNGDKAMTKETADRLLQLARSNEVQLQKTVKSSEAAAIIDSQEEVQLIVPASALKEDTTLTVHKEEAGASRPEVLSSIFELGPDGTTFEKPVYVAIKAPLYGKTLDQLALVWLNESTGQWVPIPAVLDAETGIVTGAVNHFTKFAVIDKTKLKTADTNKLSEEVGKALAAVVRYVRQQEDGLTDWEAYGLAVAGEQVPAAYVAGVESLLQEKEGRLRLVTDYERIALGVHAAGGNPRDIAGYDLIDAIVNHQQMTLQGTNGPIFALTVLNEVGHEVETSSLWTREKLLSWLLERQHRDGGWPLAEGDSSSIDITAMALTSLAPHVSKPGVKAAVDRALGWLSTQQRADGGFGLEGTVPSESSAQVVLALSSLGISAEDERFVKAGGSVLSHLLTYQQADGGFAHLKGEPSSDIATEQALLALATYAAREQVTLSAAFTDASSISPWAAGYVQKAVKHGLMNGMDGQRFAPQQSLTRAQFVAIVLRLKGIQPVAAGQATKFDDVEPGSWYAPLVAEAHRQGFIEGMDERRFAPDRQVTREEMAIMLARAYGLTSLSAANLAPFLDIADANASSLAAIQAVQASGYMEGDDRNRFLPQAAVTREMAAAVAVRVLEKQRAS
ncbi:S-layer homology domain-containing protein [Paenibacillus sp. YYML68]|uniref:S-layer homology domain-containing protein n=1 Tax=Paenibacillus sp. YYML68 TaxID=2909250 RepID=UPI0024912505|nr:S-layer homology domain-containing protein [Paenibacillus sp. YYML68]